MSNFLILNTRPEHAEACAMLQTLCYPTLAKEEHLTAEQYLSHLRVFPEGQFVAVDRATGRVVGSTAGLLAWYDCIDITHFQNHTYMGAIGNGWFTNHDPLGNYYYGADLCVHPDHRGQGIARLLYDARKDLCRRLNLRGQVIGGMLPGFAQYKHELSVEEYVQRVCAGAIYDPTLTTQLRNGFEPRGLLQNYLNDPPSDGWCVLLEWRNPDYRPKSDL